MPLRTPRTDQRGFTMVTMMGVLLIVVSLVFVTYSAADGDLASGKHDEERKVAYAAAEAGIQNYLFHLTQNDDYWAKCDSVPSPHAVNQKFAGAIPTTAKRLKVPGSRASYVLELLPANGKPACVVGSTDSMIDSATGTFRIRSTGYSRDTDPVKRSIVTTFKRKSFLEYIYFTDFETQDPALYRLAARFGDDGGGRVNMGLNTRENPRTPSSLPQRDVVAWGTETCASKHWSEGRGSIPNFVGNQTGTGIFYNGAWRPYGAACGEINFFGPSSATNGDTAAASPPASPEVDVIQGPMHTNDSVLICGYPRFGRSPQDKIEVAGSPGWRANSSCGTSAPNANMPGGGAVKTKVGTWAPNSAPLTLPPSNAQLRTDALPAYRFEGRTKILLDNTQMVISGKREDGTTLTDARVNLPANGALYVRNAGSCGNTYDPLKTSPTPTPAFGTGCGNIEISGTYSVSATMGADNDILITEDVLKSGGFGAAGSPVPAPDVLFGLIANNFVRVHHPVTGLRWDDDDDEYECTNNGGPAPNMRIDAAILAIGHSFIHDNYLCGAATGTLTVNGAISQRYRGFVSVGNPPVHGFKKNYVYDDRMKFRSPPHFIDPVNAGWQVQLYTEQSPAK